MFRRLVKRLVQHLLFHKYKLALVSFSLVWIALWLAPLSSIDPYGGYKFIGFLVIDLAFLILGLFGLYLYRQRKLEIDLPFTSTCTPLYHLAALITPEPWNVVLFVLSFVWIAFICFVAPLISALLAKR